MQTVVLSASLFFNLLLSIQGFHGPHITTFSRGLHLNAANEKGVSNELSVATTVGASFAGLVTGGLLDGILAHGDAPYASPVTAALLGASTLYALQTNDPEINSVLLPLFGQPVLDAKASLVASIQSKISDTKTYYINKYKTTVATVKALPTTIITGIQAEISAIPDKTKKAAVTAVESAKAAAIQSVEDAKKAAADKAEANKKATAKKIEGIKADILAIPGKTTAALKAKANAAVEELKRVPGKLASSVQQSLKQQQLKIQKSIDAKVSALKKALPFSLLDSVSAPASIKPVAKTTPPAPKPTVVAAPKPMETPKPKPAPVADTKPVAAPKPAVVAAAKPVETPKPKPAPVPEVKPAVVAKPAVAAAPRPVAAVAPKKEEKPAAAPGFFASLSNVLPTGPAVATKPAAVAPKVPVATKPAPAVTAPKAAVAPAKPVAVAKPAPAADGFDFADALKAIGQGAKSAEPESKPAPPKAAVKTPEKPAAPVKAETKPSISTNNFFSGFSKPAAVKSDVTAAVATKAVPAPATAKGVPAKVTPAPVAAKVTPTPAKAAPAPVAAKIVPAPVAVVAKVVPAPAKVAPALVIAKVAPATAKPVAPPAPQPVAKSASAKESSAPALTSSTVLSATAIKALSIYPGPAAVGVETAVKSYLNSEIPTEILYKDMIKALGSKDKAFAVLPDIIGSLPRGDKKTALNSFYQNQA